LADLAQVATNNVLFYKNLFMVQQREK